MNLPVVYQIKASAGSGKTYTLVLYFLSLLAKAREDEDIDVKFCSLTSFSSYSWTEVLAITFTNKAVAEILERVLRILKNIALGHVFYRLMVGLTREKAAYLLDTILWHFSRLGIRTIDSLLVQLVRVFSLESGLSYDLEPIFNEYDFFTDLYNAFLGDLYSYPNSRSALIDVMRATLDVEQRHSGMWIDTGWFKARLMDIWQARLTGMGGEVVDRDWLWSVYCERHEAIQVTARNLAAELKACHSEPNKYFLNFLHKCATIDILTETPKSTYINKSNLEACINKTGRTRLTSTARELYAVLKQYLTDGPMHREVLRAAISLIPLVILANSFIKHTIELQRRRGISLASTWVQLVRSYLNSNRISEVFCRLGVRIAHICIDEFQDISRSQWAAIYPLVVECLIRGGSLFYVGDVKQAIYSWRGGDARLFEEISSDSKLAIAGSLYSKTLTYNWRSAATIVAYNNTFFTSIATKNVVITARMLLGKYADTLTVASLKTTIETNFRDVTQNLSSRHLYSKDIGYVRCTLINTLNDFSSISDDILSVDEGFQTSVVSTIRVDLFKTITDCLARGRQFKDIAILVRSNIQATQVAEWMIELDLPVVTENNLLLAAHPLIRQLVALLRFIDYPQDNLSFWQFISGPEIFGIVSNITSLELIEWLVGLTNKNNFDMTNITATIHNFKNIDIHSDMVFIQNTKKVSELEYASLQLNKFSSLYQYFQRDFPDIWRRWLGPLLEIGLTTPYALIKGLCDGYGIWTCWPEQEIFLRRFLEILYEAESIGYRTIRTFLEVWDRIMSEERVPQIDKRNALQVMTIHKAKGLQFPVVLVPFHAFSIRPDIRELTEIEVNGRLVLVPLIPTLGKPFTERIVQYCLEALNLIYVAWTRPKFELYLWFENTTNSLTTTIVNNLATMGIDLAKGKYEQGEQFIVGPPVVLSSLESDMPLNTSLYYKDKKGLESFIVYLPRIKVFRHLPLNMEDITIRRRGELAHRSAQLLDLSRLRFVLENDIVLDTIEIAIDRAVTTACSELEITNVEQINWLPEIIIMLRWLTRLPNMSTYLTIGLREREILAPDGSIIRPDLIVLRDRERVVVEYKTGAPRTEHRVQMEHYLTLVAALPTLDYDTELYGFLLYLDRQEVVKVCYTSGLFH